MMVKSPRPLFPKCDYGKISVKRALSLVSGTQQNITDAEQVVFINLYWKDALSEKPGEFCKHKSSSLYNQDVEVIYSFPRSGPGVTPDAGI